MKNFIKSITDRLLRKPLLVKPVVSTCFFGHKWSDGKYRQMCLRESCNGTRILMWQKHPKIDEPALKWHYYNIDDIDIK